MRFFGTYMCLAKLALLLKEQCMLDQFVTTRVGPKSGKQVYRAKQMQASEEMRTVAKHPMF